MAINRGVTGVVEHFPGHEMAFGSVGMMPPPCRAHTAWSGARHCNEVCEGAGKAAYLVKRAPGSQEGMSSRVKCIWAARALSCGLSSLCSLCCAVS